MAYSKDKKEDNEQKHDSEASDKKQAPKIKKAPPVCDGCWRWPAFQDKCWYYWDGKKFCTFYSNDPNELPPY